MKTVMCYTAGQATKALSLSVSPLARATATAGFGGPEKARPRAATMWRHGAAKKVEGVQRFSVSEAFFAFLLAAIQEAVQKRRPQGRLAYMPCGAARYFFSAQMV